MVTIYNCILIWENAHTVTVTTNKQTTNNKPRNLLFNELQTVTKAQTSNRDNDQLLPEIMKKDQNIFKQLIEKMSMIRKTATQRHHYKSKLTTVRISSSHLVFELVPENC